MTIWKPVLPPTFRKGRRKHVLPVMCCLPWLGLKREGRTWVRRDAMAAVPPAGPEPGPAGPAPAPAAPAAPAVDALTLGSADLRFLLQRQGIDDDHLRKLFSAAVDSMDKFSAFASGEEDLLSVLKDEFRLDPATNLATRGQVASFIAAWKSAKVRVQRQAEVEAEQDTRELIKPVPTSEYLLLPGVCQGLWHLGGASSALQGIPGEEVVGSGTWRI